MAATSGHSNYKWQLVGVLFFVAALNYGDRAAITAVFPLLRRDLGMSDAALGATGSVFLWTYALCSPFAGYLGDRAPRSRLLAASLGGWSLVMILSALVTSASQLLWLRAALGVAEAAYIPASTALIADYHGPETRGKAIGIHIAGFSFGLVGGGWLSGYLGESIGWRPSFLVLGSAGLVLTVICLLTLHDKARGPSDLASGTRESMGQSVIQIVRIPSFLVLTAEILLSGVATWVFINWLPLYFHETFSLSLAMAGFYGSIWLQAGRALGLLAGGIPSDLLARRDPRHRMLLMGICYLLAGPLLLAFAWTGSFAVIAAAIFIYSLLTGMGYVNSQPLLCDLLPARLRSTAIGVMNLGSCLAGGAGVLAAGLLKQDVGLARSFASLAILVIAIGGILLIAWFTCLRGDLARSARRAMAEAAIGARGGVL